MVAGKKRTIDLAPVAKYGIPLVIAVALGIWYYVTHTPEAMVKRQLRSLAETVSKHQGEGNTSTALKMVVFENMLDDNVVCGMKDFPYNGDNSGNTLASLVFRGRSMLDSVDLSLVDVECEIRPNGEALARCAGHLRLYYNGNAYSESRNCLVLLTKRGKSWKISGFKDDELLKK